MDESARGNRFLIVEVGEDRVRVMEHLPWREELAQSKPREVTLARVRWLEREEVA